MISYKSFIKVLFLIIAVISMALPCISFAEDEEFIVKPIEVVSIDNNKILGNFTLINNSDKFIPKISYVINLAVEDKIGEQDIPISVNNIPATILELRPREEKIVSFEYKIPENLPKKEYFLYLRVAQKDVISDSWKMFTNIGVLGNGNEFINMSERSFELLDSALKTYNITIAPEVKKESEIKLSLKSNFNETIVATPKVKIFYPNMFNSRPAVSYEGEAVAFEPGKDTDFTLKIPPLNNAGQYLVKVAMYKGDKQVSQTLELSCFVNGKVASIVNTTAKLNEKNEVIVESLLLGNRLSSDYKEYELKYKIYNKDTSKLLKEEVKKVKLNYEVISDEITISDIKDSNILVNLLITDKEQLLSANSIEISKEKLTIYTSKEFSDVTSEKHKAAIIALSDMGFLSGYPDGTFRPYNNITRAEFTVLATRLASLELISQPSNFTDVADDYWAKDFINAAYKKKYLSGYGNGLFMPNNNVTYQEAATILVNILGYPTKDTPQSKIESFNNLIWPNNYIEAGVELGLFNNISVENLSWPATRQDVALLILNAYLNK